MQEMIFGAGPVAGKVPLTAIDTLWGHPQAYQLYLYKNRLDVPTLKATLHKMLTTVPDVAGRLIGDAFGREYIDRNNRGIIFDVVDIDETAPDYGVQRVIEDDAERYVRPPVENLLNSDEPLFNVQVTRFQCGTTILGIRWPHSLCDGTGYTGFLARWARLCRGESSLPGFDLDREKLLRLYADRTPPATVPSLALFDEAGLRSIGEKLMALSAGKRYRAFVIAGDDIRRLKADSADSPVEPDQWVSTQDLVTAKIWQTIARSQQTHDALELGALYNYRDKAGLGIGADYFGNAITFGVTQFDSDELRVCSLKGIALRLRRVATASVDADKIKDELSYVQDVKKRGAGSCMARAFLCATTTGTIANNVSRFPLHELDFGSGSPYWIGGPARFHQRYFTLYPNADGGGGLILHLNLPQDEMNRFIDIARDDPFFRGA